MRSPADLSATGVDASLLRAIERAAAAAGLGPVADVRPLARAGANNRAYRARVGPREAFVKRYFRAPAPARDRLASEWAFARLAWDASPGDVAEPLAADEQGGVALFAWVEGRPVPAGGVTEAHVGAALAFVERLASLRGMPAAACIGSAAEACFSVAEHLALVESRVAMLCEQGDAPARAFARERLEPAWRTLEAGVRAAASAVGLDLDARLAPERLCLSPSDFGFHNALVRADGTLAFHDFEYAGWDDPAKLVGDFFAQVAAPVDGRHAPRFVERLASVLGLDAADRARIATLRPVYRLKWCCIVLNELLPAARERRAFAAGGPVAERRKRAQLAKAEALLAAVQP